MGKALPFELPSIFVQSWWLQPSLHPAPEISHNSSHHKPCSAANWLPRVGSFFLQCEQIRGQHLFPMLWDRFDAQLSRDQANNYCKKTLFLLAPRLCKRLRGTVRADGWRALCWVQFLSLLEKKRKWGYWVFWWKTKQKYSPDSARPGSSPEMVCFLHWLSTFM